MAAEEFFRRWAKPASQPSEAASPELVVPTAALASAPPGHVELEQLQHESDFSRFMAADVEPDVRRLAMKKLFTNPHFNIMDGLDIYIGDYSQPDPLPAGMLESLLHAQTLLNPLAHLQAGVMRMVESPVVDASDGTDAAEVVMPSPLIDTPDTLAALEAAAPPHDIADSKLAVKEAAYAVYVSEPSEHCSQPTARPVLNESADKDLQL